MFNAKRIETIRKNIQTSTLLSDHEKSDWLNLLELMNDKQLGELEDILSPEPQPQPQPQPQAQQSQPAPVSAPSPTPSTSPSTASLTDDRPALPPLTHIANIPTDVTMTHSVPAVPVRPTPSPNLSAGGASLTPPKPNYAKPSHIVKDAAPQNSKTAPLTSKSQTPYLIHSPEDLQNLEVKTIREFSLQSIFDAVRKSIEEVGYFAVLQSIEASPLYSSYISAGQERLGAAAQPQNDSQLSLTQAEFEFMADLLRNMRFNRW